VFLSHFLYFKRYDGNYSSFAATADKVVNAAAATARVSAATVICSRTSRPWPPPAFEESQKKTLLLSLSEMTLPIFTTANLLPWKSKSEKKRERKKEEGEIWTNLWLTIFTPDETDTLHRLRQRMCTSVRREGKRERERERERERKLQMFLKERVSFLRLF